MKKTLVFVLALVAALSMFCTSAFAGQGAIVPTTWDGFEFNLRKADPAKVVKDGKIGVDEYDEIKLSNKDEVFINYSVPDDKDFDWEAFKTFAKELRDSMKVYVSWDETNGFNTAVQYKVPKNQFKCENPNDGGETFVMSKLGGVLLQIRNNAECTPLDDPDKTWADAGVSNGNVIYDNIGWNTASESLLHCLYQSGYGGKSGTPYTAADANYGFSYDEDTEIVTFEVSYPLNQVIREDDPNKIYYAPQAMRGYANKGDWGQPLAIACFGQTGFYVKQEIVTDQRCMTLVKVDEAVGYVEPEPTPTPEPTPIIKEVEKEVKVEVVPIYSWIIIAVLAVAVIALVVVMATKKKA